MKRLLSLITALAAFVGFAEGTLPADADASASTAESPLCVGFSFNNGAARPQSAAAKSTSATKDTNGTVKQTIFALEESVWFYSNPAQANNGEIENVFPFTVEDETPDATGTAKPTITWSSENVYSTGRSASFLDGYLDDGEGVTIAVSNLAIRYANGYDVVIYFATDTANVKFHAPTVNGKQYTFDETNPIRAKEGADSFGNSSRLTNKSLYGVNALRVCDLTGDLTITTPVPTQSQVARSCVSAIQILPAGHSSLTTLTIPETSTTDVKWSTAANWTNNVVAATTNTVRIVLKCDATLDLDQDINVTNLIVEGSHTLTFKKSEPSKTTHIVSMPISPATIVVEDASAYTSLASVTTLDTPLTVKTKIEGSLPFASVTAGRTFAGGAGSESSPVSYTCAGGSLTLKGEGENSEPFYIADSSGKTTTDSGTTVTFDGAKVEYKGSPGRFSVGNAAFTLINATVTAESLWLSEGAGGRNARLTLAGTSVLTVTGTTDIDQNTSSIMFGHYNGQSTFTLNGESQFLASSQVLVGKTGNNHTINVNGGLFSAKGIKLSGNASGTNKLNLNGGTLALDSVGIATYNTSRTMAVTVGGDATMRAKAETFPISQAVTIAEGKTLTLDKTNDVSTTSYAFSKSISGEGKILVKPGVNVNFGTARPKKLKVENADSEISFTLSTESGDEAVIQCEGLTSLDNVKIYQPNGTTAVVTATFATLTDTDDTNTKTLTIKPWQTLNCTEGDISFEDATKWSGASSTGIPSSGDIIIKTVAGKTCTVTVGESHSYGTIYVIGTGTVVLKGAGVLTPSGNVTVRTGATLALASASVIAEGKTLNFLSDSTLAILDLPSSTNQFKNVISGAGRVETFCDVKFTKASSFTGGLTVKRGTASTTTQKGFGGVNDNNTAGSITVANGGCLDIAYTWNRSYAITIAGNGVATTNANGTVSYSGAIKNTETPTATTGFGYTKTQTKSLTLTADALITVEEGKPWGILASGWGATTLNFAGHTLTKQGAGEFFLSNVQTSSAGILAIKEGKLTIYKRDGSGGASNLANTKLFLFGNSTLDLVTNLNGLNQLRFCPSAGGVTVNNLERLASTTQKILSGAGFEGNKMGSTSTDGGTVVLVKGTANTITNGFLSSVSLGGRFKKTDGAFALTYNTEGSELTATLQAPTKFFHYDFNNSEASHTASKAADSVYQFGGWNNKNGSGPFIVNKGRNGKSGNFFYKTDSNRQTPYWDGTSAPHGALDNCGALTVTTVARLMCASRNNGKVPLWCLGSLAQNGTSLIGLVAIDNETVAAVAADSTSGSGSAMRELARVTGIKNLTTAFHFFALVVTGEESRLYVDRMPPAVTVGARAPINAMANKGQIGAFHGGSNAYPRLANGDGGFYLDDFQVYDAILSDKEIQELRRKFCPDPFFMIVQ